MAEDLPPWGDSKALNPELKKGSRADSNPWPLLVGLGLVCPPIMDRFDSESAKVSDS